MPKTPTHASQELDKLKRRLIRSVARLVKEKKTEHEVWQELKKECGTNCKTLWLRMRSLTLKKLKRLLDAGDRYENVPSVARMTLTDWLLYDLVLVHEKIDVINRNSNESSRVLENLFELVRRFRIEGRNGDNLAEAWTAATVNYNSKGHQCSPMLMQRRWFQIKELTRHKLYKFWFNYKGNEKLLLKAKLDPPTPLQRSIALEYPHIITQAFPTWDEGIEQKLVIMPEEFEVKMRKKNLMKPRDETVPDVVIVEQTVETITVDSESEHEDGESFGESIQNPETNSRNEESLQTPIIVQVKSEPQDYDDNIDITEHHVYPENPKDRFQEAIARLKFEEDRLLTECHQIVSTKPSEIQDDECDLPFITNITGATDSAITTTSQTWGNIDVQRVNENYAVETLNQEKEISIQNAAKDGKKIDVVDSTFDNNSQESILINDDDENVMPLIINIVGATGSTTANTSHNLGNINMEVVEVIDTVETFNVEKEKIIRNAIDGERLDVVESAFDDDNVMSANIVKNDKITSSINEVENIVDFASLGVKKALKDSNNISFIKEQYLDLKPIVDNVELVKSMSNNVCPVITAIASGPQVESKMEMNTDFHNDFEQTNDVISGRQEEDIIRLEPKPLIEEESLKLCHEIVADTKFDDDGIEFADDGIEYVDEYNVDSQSNEITESPQKKDSAVETFSPKFDLKLLMDPVVYTTKLDEMNVYKGISVFDTIDKKDLFDKILIESKPVSANTINVEQIKGDNETNIKETNTIVKVKVENSHEFDDNLFQNDSSDDESEYIENIRIKLSSSLLQKPKSRSYNPIQLCKNPDFNTRLKRLPIGFFSSQRNRVFLKACKPMTIDLSKAFESKLLNGTLYVESNDSDIIKEAENKFDKCESAVSILPSAVAVQSLMDTADVDKILQEELRKRMLDRNKIINLPNISVVRQINQQLLMAEVAPIMVQIEKSGSLQEAPVQTIAEKEISITVPLENIVERKENTKKAHTNEITNEIPKEVISVTNISQSREELTNQEPNKVLNLGAPILPMMNSVNKSTDLDDTNIQKPKYQRKMNILPSWSTKFSQSDLRTYGAEDSLLTIDTLYKVLNTLDPSSVEYKPKIKHTNKGKSSQNRCHCSSSKIGTDQKGSGKKETEAIVIDSNAEKLPAAPTEPEKKDSTVKMPYPRNKQKKHCCWARGMIAKLQGYHKANTKHRCRIEECKCCCREILRQAEIDNEIKILESMQNRNTYNDTIEQVVQQSRDIPHAAESSIHVGIPNTIVDHPNAVQPISPQNNANEDALIQEKVNDSCAHNVADIISKNIQPLENIETLSSVLCAFSGTEGEEGTINIDDDDDDDVKEVPESVNQTPKPTIRVYSAGASGGFRSTNQCFQPVKETPIISPIIEIPPLIPIEVTPGFKTTAFAQPLIKKTPAIRGRSYLRGRPRGGAKMSKQVQKQTEVAALPCSCRPNVAVDGSSSMLVVDGSNECKRHTTTRVSKETIIYLNRKHIAERPFFVGNNKILLTNIIPLRLQDQVRQMPVTSPPLSTSLTPAVPLMMPISPLLTLPQPAPSAVTSHSSPDPASLELPTGVQVILLLDGTVSYTTEPDTVLTKEQIDAMPLILHTVQKQISASGVTLPIHVPPPQHNSESTGDNNASKTMEIVHNVSNDEYINMEIELTKNSNGNHKVSSAQYFMEENKDNPNTTDNAEQINENLEFPPMTEITNVLENKLESENIHTYSLPANKTIVKNESTVKDITQTESSVCSTEPLSNVENHPTDEANNESANTDNTEQVPSSTCENTNTTSNNIGASTNRNLLSDLMEMSGILEEDVTPVHQEAGPIITPGLESEQTTQDPPRTMSPHRSIYAEVNEVKYDLNAIVSFSELKYACDNNGLFFKLDLNSGLIVPINVCIQKTASEEKSVTSEVIDLTDEPSYSIGEKETTRDVTTAPATRMKTYQHTKANRITMKLKSRNISLMKKLPPTKGCVYVETQKTAEDRKLALIKRLSNNLKPLKILQNERINTINMLRKNEITRRRERKQIMNERMTEDGKNMININVHINLSDSDEPMEEEYLDDSDDSDDEPLAKIAKKMRENCTGADSRQEFPEKVAAAIDNEEEDFEEAAGVVDHENVDFEEVIDAKEASAISNSLLLSNNAAMRPVPKQLMLSGPSVSQPIILNDSFLENEGDDEDSQDNCILGV